LDPVGWLNLAEFAAWLETSAVGQWMRASDRAYPVVNLVHLLGLVLLVGPMLLLDLRLLGAGRQYSLPQVSATLTRWAIAGLLLLLPSGALLFSADAGPLLANPVMQLKLLLIALGIANALLFRLLWSDRLDEWDLVRPRAGQLQATLSALCWLATGTLGRLIAYA
jgi:hypothetical protein